MLHLGKGRIAVCILAPVLLHGCASFTGYPDDPVPGTSDLPALRDYFDPGLIVAYNRTGDPVSRRQQRDNIVMGRIAGYDLMFRRFQRQLTSEANGTNVSSDLTVLILNGVGSVTGTAATKSALAAAALGVGGAKGVISKDLFYEKTLPSLFSQMQASRKTVLARILAGLARDDAGYSLAIALVDLNDYRDAGSIPGAIAGVTEQAAIEKAAAEFKIDEIRSVGLADVASTKAIVAWLYPNGSKFDAEGNTVDPIPAKLKELQQWLKAAGRDDIPWYDLLGDTPSLEALRQSFMAAKGLK